MKKILIIIIFLLISTSSFAQELPELSSDRPDQSESPDIVPLRNFQIEMLSKIELTVQGLHCNEHIFYFVWKQW